MSAPATTAPVPTTAAAPAAARPGRLLEGYYRAGADYQVTTSARTPTQLHIRRIGPGSHPGRGGGAGRYIVATLTPAIPGTPGTPDRVTWRTTTPRVRVQVLALLADPDAARTAYAHTAGCCWRCGRVLTDRASIAAGLGADCAAQLAHELAGATADTQGSLT